MCNTINRLLFCDFLLLRHIILYISSVNIAKNNYRVEQEQRDSISWAHGISDSLSSVFLPCRKQRNCRMLFGWPHDGWGA